MALQQTLLVGLALIIALAPLPFGSVQVWSRASLTALCFLLSVIWAVWRRRTGQSVLPWRDPIIAAGALLLLVGLLQLIPLPRAVLSNLSPGAVEFHDRYEAPAEPHASTHELSPTPFEGVRPVSLDPWSTRQSALFFLAMMLVTLITINLVDNRQARWVLALTLVASGAFQAIYGLGEYISDHQHIFGYTKRFFTNVATGTLINRNHFAAYLAMVMPMAIALACEFADRNWKRSGVSKTAMMARGTGRDLYIASAFLVVALVMATALASSRSRMGIISASLSLVIIGLVVAWRSRRTGYAVAILLLGGGTIIILAQGAAGSGIAARFLMLSDALHGAGSRWEIWSETIAMAREYPLLGIGWGAYPNIFRVYRVSGPGVAVDHAENDYLELIAEVGVVGIILIVIGAMIVALPMIRKRIGRPDFDFMGYGAAAGLIAVGMHSLTDSILMIPSNALTLAVLFGVLIGWLRVPAPTLALPSMKSSQVTFGAVLVSVLLAGASVGSLSPAAPYPDHPSRDSLITDDVAGGDNQGGVLPALGNHLDGDNPERILQMAAASGASALRDMEAIVKAKPDGPFAPDTIGYIVQRIDNAERIAGRATRLLPSMWSAHVLLAQLEFGRCTANALRLHQDDRCPGEAIGDLLAALELNPLSATTHVRVATILLRYWPVLEDEAREVVRPAVVRALELNRRDQALALAASVHNIKAAE